MKENLFTIPKTITAGYQYRTDSYSGRLSYIIYTDDEDVLRKEKSWNSWRDNTIPTTVNDNEPHSGFFINKSVGGYVNHWMRQSYIRIYDSTLNLEFEITLPNLNYILNNCSWSPDKGLDGDFVYAWYGTDLWLLPVNSEAYKASTELTKRVKESKKFKEKDLVVGHGYRFKDGSVFIYLGKLTRFYNNPHHGFTHVTPNDYDKHFFGENSNGFIYNKQVKNIIEDCGAFTITNPELSKRLFSEEFNYTGTAYFHVTPTSLKDLLSSNARLYVYSSPVTIECVNLNNKEVYKGTYVETHGVDRYKQNTGYCSLAQLANRVHVIGVFKDGKLSHILT